MENFIFRKIKRLVKWVLAILPFGTKIVSFFGSKWAYKRNFGKIKFQGQFLQDMIAYLYLSPHPRHINRFFVDIGANDGIIGSNTYIFEQLGWKGICVEPQPDIFNHYLKRQRKCDLYNVALSSKSGDNIEFFKAHGAPALSGLNENMSEGHKKWAAEYGKIEIINVKTTTFEEIMKKHPDIKHIDFMSIDVEGHEMEILKTINFNEYKFDFVTIEKSDPDKIIKHMQENGYKIFMEIGADIMFIPKNK
jgi:FkbM family methyltransferase